MHKYVQRRFRYYCAIMPLNAAISVLVDSQIPFMFPHVKLLAPWQPRTVIPKPIFVLGVLHLFSLLATIPIRKFILALTTRDVFRISKASSLQFSCKTEPTIRDFHALFPAVVLMKFPPAITSNSELAWWRTANQFVTSPMFIPRHILSKGVFQCEAILFVLLSNRLENPSSTA